MKPQEANSAVAANQSSHREAEHTRSEIWELGDQQKEDDFLLFKDFIDVKMLGSGSNPSIFVSSHNTSTPLNPLRSHEEAHDSIHWSETQQALNSEEAGGSGQSRVICFKNWNSQAYETFVRSGKGFLQSSQKLWKDKIGPRMRQETYHRSGEVLPSDIEYDRLLWTNRDSEAKKLLRTILSGYISNDKKSTSARDQAMKHGQDWIKSHGGTEFPSIDDDLWFFATLYGEPDIKWGKR